MWTRDGSYDKDKLRVLRPPFGGAAQTGPSGTPRRRDLPRVGIRSEGRGGGETFPGRESESCRGGRVCPLARIKREAGSRDRSGEGPDQEETCAVPRTWTCSQTHSEPPKYF